MALPEFTMRQLMEAGVHFGHRVHRWDPRMAPYIYGARSGIHIIDLSKTVPLLYRALDEVRKIAAKGGRILFVGTKRQASQAVAESAERCAQYYMNHRWLGGTLTNWETVSKSIKRLCELDELLAETDQSGLTKKELLGLTRERDKYQRTLGGIRNMGGRPDLAVIIDIHREGIAVREARKLGVPIIGIIDTNCDPSEVDFPIPGNDDAIRAVRLYCDLIANAVLDGMSETAMAAGIDIGESEHVDEPALADQAKDAAPSDPESDVAPSDVEPVAEVETAPSEDTEPAQTSDKNLDQNIDKTEPEPAG